ncbi:mycofactocin biosynthesis glycosyltransferase MftF [soil metagenome]
MTDLPAPPASALPPGFVVALNRRVRVRDEARVLVGGSPTRVLYLTEKARRLIVNGRLTVASAQTGALADRLLDAGMADPVAGELADRPAGVTYVVPARDRPDALGRLLQSIDPGHPIVVVDDCSLDPGPIARLAEQFGAELVALPVNVGPGAARDAGLARVRTEFVVFVDSDIVIEPGAIELLLRHFADERVALVCPRVAALRTDEKTRWIGKYEEARSSLDLGLYPSAVRPRSTVSWVPSACLVARVSAIGAGFSPELRVGEDVDLVWRLAHAGWRIRYEPAAEVRHEHRVHLGDWMLRKAVYGTGAYELGRRHPDDIAPAILPPWSVALMVALLAQRRWSLPVAAGVFVYTVGRVRAKLGKSEHPTRLALGLTANGTVAALVQGSALLLRHWWPVTAVACVFSPAIRRATAFAAAADIVVEFARTTTTLDPVRFGLARRLDDLAYGAGVWYSAIRGRSLTALLPDFRGKERSTARRTRSARAG